MKNTPKSMRSGNNVSIHTLAGVLCTLGLVAAAAVLLVLYWITGDSPLLLAALTVLLPALVQLPLLLRIGQKDPKKSTKLSEWFQQKRVLITAGLIAVLMALVHLLYWLNFAGQTSAQAGYFVPVVLAALIVLSVVAEKWSKYAGDQSDVYKDAILQNVHGALKLSKWVLILLTLGVTVRLLGFYDTTGILKVLITVILVYETVRILWGLVQRLVRRELDTRPALPMGLFQNAQEDTDILTYMEENTGITMRSLWSIRFVKSLIPAAVIGIVLVLWLATGIVVVDTNQEGAVYRLGRLQEETLKPGLHLTLPWPMDKVEVYDTKSIGTVTIGYVPEGEMDNLWTENHGIEEYRLLLGSGDEMVSINLKIQYRISDLYAYISSSAAPESMLQAKAYEIVTARTITADLEALLATDRQAFSQSFRQELTEKIAPHRTGLEVVDVVLESIHPPVEVADVYQKIISAGIEAEQLVIEAQNKATQKMMTAQAKYTTAVSDALVVKYNSVADAKASVAEFMASVAADDTYRAEYRFYKYLNALTKYYGKANLILVGDGLDASNLYIGSWNGQSGTLIN